MGKVNHAGVYEQLIATHAEEMHLKKEDKVFKRYANKTLPSLNKTSAGLNPYVGQWTEEEVIHLLRRTTFGVKPADVQTLLGMTMSQAVDYLLNNIPATISPPVNSYETATYTDPTGVPSGQPWVTAPYGDGTVNAKRRSSFKAWWMGQIINQNLSIQEKMTLFWHNHFATETTTISDARLAYKHHELLKTMALGNFKTLVREVTTDPAMLRYLNGYLNTKTAPDENYARELFELFTLGKNYTPIYSEPDIKAAAKVLTGWRIDSTNLTGYFDDTKHDTTNKQFSSFFNSTTINGQTGAAGATETDALMDMIFNNPNTAPFICRKLYRYFVYYEIDATVETSVIQPLAQELVLNNWQIKPTLATLLKSEHFFDVLSRSCYIRTPADFIGGMFRTFGITLPANFTVNQTYAIWNYLRGYGGLIGQDIGDPPDVAGWPAFYQVPEYYEIWINSTTLPNRMAFADMMLNTGFTAGTGSDIKIDVLAFAQQFANVGDPDALIDYCIQLLFGLPLSQSKKDSIKTATLLSGQSSNYYWSIAWNDYITNPNTVNTGIVKTRLISLLTELMRMAEHQLC